MPWMSSWAMHLQQTYIDLVSPAYHLWQTGVFLYEPRIDAYDKVSRSCGYTPGKVTGQRATVKAEMNGLTPGLDRHPPSR